MPKHDDYIERIALSKLFLVVTAKLYEPGFIKSELETSLSALDDYLDSDDFESLSVDEKNETSLTMLADTINTALPYLTRACEKRIEKSNSDKSCQITKSQAIEMLQMLYQKDAESGDGDFLNMNINEWIEKSGLTIVADPKDDLNKKS